MTDIDKKRSTIRKYISTDRARIMMEIVPTAMIVIDEEGSIQGFSKAAEQMFGYTEQEVAGQNVSLLMSSPHRSRHDGYLRHYRQTGEKRIIGAPRLENARRRDGSVFPMELTIGEMELEGERLFIGFIRQLSKPESDRREISNILAELAHASRISAMGAMATAMAHELNQPLTSIANYADGLKQLISQRADIAGSEEYIGILENCSRQALRAGQLIYRLREFVKGGTPHREAVDINTLLNEAISLAMINGFKKAVGAEANLPDNLLPVYGDHLQVQQVLFNLIRNAIEAMDLEDDSRHDLRITARNVSEEFVEVCVEDSGPGIDPALADTVFNSFVTTKQDGMGVGLAICKQIVEDHGGQIRAGSSAELGGAAFYVTLPAFHAGQAASVS